VLIATGDVASNELALETDTSNEGCNSIQVKIKEIFPGRYFSWLSFKARHTEYSAFGMGPTRAMINFQFIFGCFRISIVWSQIREQTRSNGFA